MSEQKPVSAKAYRRMTPHDQGYVSYMQGAWNKEIPDRNPYDAASPEAKEWNRSNQRAMLNVQDMEE